MNDTAINVASKPELPGILLNNRIAIGLFPLGAAWVLKRLQISRNPNQAQTLQVYVPG
jgi:hypothetical protein